MSNSLTAAMMAAALLSSAPQSYGQVQVAQADSSRRVCTQQYEPVCARRGTSYRTFANACEAQVSGYFVARKGRCEGDRDRVRRNDPPEYCTRQYDPVCAIRGNRRKSFSNACEAQRADYRIVHGGRC